MPLMRSNRAVHRPPRGGHDIVAPSIGVVLFTVTLAVSLAMAIVSLLSRSAIPPGFALALGTLGVCAYPIARRLLTRSFDVFEPIVSGCAMLALLFGVRPIWMVTSGDLTANQGSRGIFDVSAVFTQVAFLGLIGSIAFVGGYEFLSWRRTALHSPRAARSAAHFDPDGLRAFAIGAWVLGIGLFLVHLELSGGIAQTLRLMLGGRSRDLGAAALGSSEYLTAAPLLISCYAIVLIATRAPRLPRSQVLLAFVAAAIPTALALLVGSRRFAIPSALIPLVVLYLVTGRRPSISGLAVVLPIVFILLATVIFARSSGARQQNGGVAPIFQQAFANPQNTWETFIGGHDTAMFAWLGVEVYAIDSRATRHTFGRASLGDLALAPVPSLLVPGKPVGARDQLLIDIFGTRCDTGTCPDFSAIGTFYQDFAEYGVVIGMFLLGLGAARVWRTFRAAPHDPWAAALAATAAVFLPILIRAGFMPAFQWFLYFVIPISIGMYLAYSRATAAPDAA